MCDDHDAVDDHGKGDDGHENDDDDMVYNNDDGDDQGKGEMTMNDDDAVMSMSRLEEVDLLTDLPESLREMQEELLQVLLT